MNYQLWAMAAGAALATTFCRGFQNKSVARGYKGLAFFCGSLMAGLDAAVVLTLARSGMEVIPFTAAGAGIGWVLGMVVHDRMTANARRAEKLKKREKRQQRLVRMLAQIERETTRK